MQKYKEIYEEIREHPKKYKEIRRNTENIKKYDEMQKENTTKYDKCNECEEMHINTKTNKEM